MGVGGGKSAFHEVIESLAALENSRWKFGECKQPLERTDAGQLNKQAWDTRLRPTQLKKFRNRIPGLPGGHQQRAHSRPLCLRSAKRRRGSTSREGAGLPAAALALGGAVANSRRSC